jgi:hypothetical protein
MISIKNKLKKERKMQKTLLFIITLFFITCDSPNESENTSWIFVANEGNFGASNGSISMIDDDGNVFETHALGEIVQSLEVYNDKLIVLINGGENQSPEDSKIKIFNITSNTKYIIRLVSDLSIT